MKRIDKISPQLKSRINVLVQDYKNTNDLTFLTNFIVDIIRELWKKNNFLGILYICKEMVQENIPLRKGFLYYICANAFISLSEFGYARLAAYEGIINFLEHETKMPFNIKNFPKESISDLFKHHFSSDDGIVAGLMMPLGFLVTIQDSYWEKNLKLHDEKEKLILCWSAWASMDYTDEKKFLTQNRKEITMLTNCGVFSFTTDPRLYVVSNKRIGLLGVLESYLYGNAENYA